MHIDSNPPRVWNLTPLEVFDCIWSSCQYLWIHCDHCCPAPKVLCRLSSLSSCLTYILFSTNFAQSTQSTCYPTMMMLQYLYLNILGDANTSRRLPCSWLFYHKPRTDFFEPTDLHTVPQLCWSGSATRHGLHLAEGCKIASLVVLWSLAEFQTPRPSAVFFAAEARRRCLCWTSGTRGKHDIYTCLPDRNPPNLAARYRQINCLWHSGPAFAPNADFGQRFEVWRDVTAWDQECNQHLAASGSWKVVRQSATWKI